MTEEQINERLKTLEEESAAAFKEFSETIPIDKHYSNRIFAAMKYANCRSREMAAHVRKWNGLDY